MDEKRRHMRFSAAEEAVVLGTARPGRLVDVSRGGIGVTYPGTENLDDEITIDLLHTAKNILLENIRCRKVTDATVGKVRMFSYVAHRRLGLEFIEPPPEVLDMIGHFTAADSLNGANGM